MMTNKQIIVDGIDISECEHTHVHTSLFNEKTLVQCSAFFLENEDSCCNCSDNPNCYYKQFKAKEQECEELKNKFLELNGKAYSNSLELDQLKAENEKLDTENKRLVAELTNPVFDSFEELDKLEQTLTEIKEIAEGMHDLWINKTPYTDRNNLVEHLLECELNRIRYKLDEISECEVNNEN